MKILDAQFKKLIETKAVALLEQLAFDGLAPKSADAIREIAEAEMLQIDDALILLAYADQMEPRAIGEAAQITEADVIAFLQAQAMRLRKRHPDDLVSIDLSIGFHFDGSPRNEFKAYIGGESCSFFPINRDKPALSIGEAVELAIAFDIGEIKRIAAAKKRAEAQQLIEAANALDPQAPVTTEA